VLVPLEMMTVSWVGGSGGWGRMGSIVYENQNEDSKQSCVLVAQRLACTPFRPYIASRRGACCRPRRRTAAPEHPWPSASRPARCPPPPWPWPTTAPRAAAAPAPAPPSSGKAKRTWHQTRRWLPPPLPLPRDWLGPSSQGCGAPRPAALGIECHKKGMKLPSVMKASGREREGPLLKFHDTSGTHQEHAQLEARAELADRDALARADGVEGVLAPCGAEQNMGRCFF
jgi:hypothetical protein